MNIKRAAEEANEAVSNFETRILTNYGREEGVDVRRLTHDLISFVGGLRMALEALAEDEPEQTSSVITDSVVRAVVDHLLTACNEKGTRLLAQRRAGEGSGVMDHTVETERIKRFSALEAENERLRRALAGITKVEGECFSYVLPRSCATEWQGQPTEWCPHCIATEALRDDD